MNSKVFASIPLINFDNFLLQFELKKYRRPILTIISNVRCYCNNFLKHNLPPRIRHQNQNPIFKQDK